MIQIGNGNWAVKEDNLLGFRYDETEGVYFPREMTFGRACDATRVNPDGLIERVPYNLLQQSNSFDTTWTKTNTSVTSGQSGYDGSSNAWLLTRTNTSGNLWQSVSLSGVQTFSVRLKKDTLDWVAILTNNTGNNGTYFNLNTGTQGTQGTNVTSSSIESIGNGWYLCSITLNVSTTAVYVYPAQGDLNVGGSSGSIYIQDAQLVEGTTAKPYFPTTNRQDIARIDYSSGTGALLLEPQRTNLATYSQTFDNAAWIAQDISTPTPNTAISPDGYTNAYTIEKAGGSGASGYFYTYRRITSNTTNTFSIFAKYKEGSGIIWLLGKNSATFAYFNLKTGTAPSASAGMTTKIENYGNGWYKCSFTQDYTSATQYTIGVGLCLVDGTPYYNPTSAATQGIYIWGAQFEAGSYPTSYIPTTSSSVTRLADSSYIDVNNILPSANTSTWFVQFVVPEFVAGGGDFFAKDTGGANDLRIYANNNGIVRFRVDPLAQNYDVSASVGDLAKCIMKCDSGIVSVFYNGQKKYTFSATTIDFYEMQFGQPSASLKIQSSILYPTAISDAECIALTTL